MGRMARLGVLCACVTVLFASVTSASASEVEDVTVQAARSRGNAIAVRGVMRDAAGVPIEGATIRLLRTEQKEKLEAVGETTSGPDGTYELSAEKAGRYVAQFSAAGHLGQMFAIRLPRDATMPDVVLGTGTGTISGTVHWDTSVITVPWAGWTETQISLYRRQADGTYPGTPEAVVYASFPGEPEYVSPQIPFGTYRVVFEDTTFATRVAEGVILSIDNPHVTGVDAHLSELRAGL